MYFICPFFTKLGNIYNQLGLGHTIFYFDFIVGDIRRWAGHMFDENYDVPTKPPLYLFEGKIEDFLHIADLNNIE